MRPAVAAALLFLAGGSFACFDTRSSDCSGNGDLVVFSGTKVYDDVPDDVVTQMCKCDEEYKGTDCSIYSAGIREGHCSTDDNGDACTNGGVAEGYITIASEGYGLGCPLYNIFACSCKSITSTTSTPTASLAAGTTKTTSAVCLVGASGRECQNGGSPNGVAPYNCWCECLDEETLPLYGGAACEYPGTCSTNDAFQFCKNGGTPGGNLFGAGNMVGGSFVYGGLTRELIDNCACTCKNGWGGADCSECSVDTTTSPCVNGNPTPIVVDGSLACTCKKTTPTTTTTTSTTTTTTTTTTATTATTTTATTTTITTTITTTKAIAPFASSTHAACSVGASGRACHNGGSANGKAPHNCWCECPFDIDLGPGGGKVHSPYGGPACEDARSCSTDANHNPCENGGMPQGNLTSVGVDIDARGYAAAAESKQRAFDASVNQCTYGCKNGWGGPACAICSVRTANCVNSSSPEAFVEDETGACKCTTTKSQSSAAAAAVTTTLSTSTPATLTDRSYGNSNALLNDGAGRNPISTAAVVAMAVGVAGIIALVAVYRTTAVFDCKSGRAAAAGAGAHVVDERFDTDGGAAAINIVNQHQGDPNPTAAQPGARRLRHTNIVVSNPAYSGSGAGDLWSIPLEQPAIPVVKLTPNVIYNNAANSDADDIDGKVEVEPGTVAKAKPGQLLQGTVFYDASAGGGAAAPVYATPMPEYSVVHLAPAPGVLTDENNHYDMQPPGAARNNTNASSSSV